MSRGHRASGDLIPWSLSQQYQDGQFAGLSGARIVRIATHTDVQKVSTSVGGGVGWGGGGFVDTDSFLGLCCLVLFFCMRVNLVSSLNRCFEKIDCFFRYTGKK